MQVVRNTGYIKEQQRRGKLLSLIGFVGLAIAFALVWRPNQSLILFAYAAMTFGFIFFNLGLQTVGKFTSNARKLRPDQQLDKTLTRLSDRYTLIHYPRIGKRNPDHLLVHNVGVLVLTLREVPGKVVVTGRRWRRGGNPLLRILNWSGPQLGNPTAENETEVALVKSYLAAAGLPDLVAGVIVFTNPLVQVTVTDSEVDVVDIDDLPAYVRELGEGREAPPLTGKERLAIVEALSQGKDLEQQTLRAERRRRVA
jgi:hypothetical protein